MRAVVGETVPRANRMIADLESLIIVSKPAIAASAMAASSASVGSCVRMEPAHLVVGSISTGVRFDETLIAKACLGVG